MGNAWSAFGALDAAAVAQVTAKLAGEVLGSLPLCDIFKEKLTAISVGIESYRGDGGAHESQAVEAHQLEQRMASIRELVELFAAESFDKGDAMWQALYWTLDKIEQVLKTVSKKSKIRRALGGKEIKDGFAKLDAELTKRMDDVERRLALDERAKADAFRRGVEAREEKGAAMLKQLENRAAAQQETLKGATDELRGIAAAASGAPDQPVQTNSSSCGCQRNLESAGAYQRLELVPPVRRLDLV